MFAYERAIDLREASRNLHTLERALELGESETLPPDVRTAVEQYNRDDCVATHGLREWLEQIRDEQIAQGRKIARPDIEDGAPSESVGDRAQRAAALAARLLRDVPAETSARDASEQGRWVLAHLLEWHRREAKAPWWEFFRLIELSHEDLMDERAALAGLEFLGGVDGTDRRPVHRYRYPQQDTELRVGADLRGGEGARVGNLEAIDLVARTVAIKKQGTTVDTHPQAVFAHTVVNTRVLEDALNDLGDTIATRGIDASGPYRAARDLLMRNPPRLRAGASLTGIQESSPSTLSAARALATQLERGVLPIQGPPGTGKTYTGARMICDLARAGKTVGVTVLSHKVIRNLLDAAVQAAAEEGLAPRALQKVPRKSDAPDPRIQEVDSNPAVAKAIAQQEVQLVGGTGWLWAREELREAVDVLFVDEAGQMALADVLAAALSARSLVLLGDPQQLEQPIQGSHPDGTALSALAHLLGGHQTMPPERGLFLAETWRLHPKISTFTSEAFYEDRLQSRPGLENQVLVGATPFAGAGTWYVPVAHTGNHNASVEEADRIAAIVADLTGGSVSWRDAAGRIRPMGTQDVMVIAPYNAQVATLGERLAAVRVGTVDKFQGQEAPVVIYSMATSSPEEAPRGMEFLYSLNRLNVATSRARCACILVANPDLFEPDCRTPQQMQLANAFCRYLELARIPGGAA